MGSSFFLMHVVGFSSSPISFQQFNAEVFLLSFLFFAATLEKSKPPGKTK